MGEGWEYHPGFVQRDYRLCRNDGVSYTGGDLCWVAVSPLTVSLNGTTTRLIAADTGCTKRGVKAGIAVLAFLASAWSAWLFLRRLLFLTRSIKHQ